MTVFVDTSALFAVLDADDGAHSQADGIWRRLLTQEEVLLTSNYVLVETFALVQRRLGMNAVESLSTDVTPVLNVHWVDEAEHSRAVTAILAARRRKLSLVDCVSFDIMRRLGVESCFAFDSHFEAQGFDCLS